LERRGPPIFPSLSSLTFVLENGMITLKRIAFDGCVQSLSGLQIFSDEATEERGENARLVSFLAPDFPRR